MRDDLYVGVDDEKIVVSPYPLRMREGRAARRRTGSLIEVLPAAPSGRSREDRVTVLARVTLPLLLAAAALYAAGLPWWLTVGGVATGLTVLWRRMARSARRGRFAVPTDGESQVLWAEPERVAFDRALAVARRVRRTWPGLPGMIDPAVADRSLTRSLADLAGRMARRQQIRRLRSQLQEVRDREVHGSEICDGPAVRALTAQRERVERLWLDSAESANRIIRSLDAAARAGETFLRERRIADSARAAEQVLATLTAGAHGAGRAEAAPELAARTEAVISAYRELELAETARYGGEWQNPLP